MGELSRNRPLQPRKLTNENVVRLKMSLARQGKAISIRLTLFLCSASTPKEQQKITGSLSRFLV